MAWPQGRGRVSFEILSLKQSRWSDDHDDADRPPLPWNPAIHCEVYLATSDCGFSLAATVKARRLTATLAHLAVASPEILARDRWLRLARALPPDLRAQADAKARELGAEDATYAPLTMVQILEATARIEKIEQC
jgi:hypothetical protein